jgi:putative ABC transport system substrate-binding protein
MVFLIAAGAVGNGTSLASEKPGGQCLVLISMKIKPYLEALEGIKTYLTAFPEITIESFFLEDVEASWRNGFPFLKGNHPYRSIIAVGPEAALYLNSNPPDEPIVKVFTMISNPAAIIPQQESSFCGISLSVDAKEQIPWIAKSLPDVKTLGILYNPEHNRDYVAAAQAGGAAAGIRIEPLRVDSRDEVPDLLRKNWHRLDGLLLIPDPTVISASLIKYIIKDGISNRVPVIGYNRFFIQNGALMAFVYDYEQIGKETALMLREILFEKKVCRSNPAAFTVVINQRIARQFNISAAHGLDGAVIEGNE